MQEAPSEIGQAKTVALCGEVFERIACGQRYDEITNPPDWCSDCGVAKGEIHQVGCDCELCPCCGDQFAFCECHREHKRWLEKQEHAKRPTPPPEPDPCQGGFGF